MDVCAAYLSLARTRASPKRNRCLSLVPAPSATRTGASSSSSPFSLARPRTNGLWSADTRQVASSLVKTHTNKKDG